MPIPSAKMKMAKSFRPSQDILDLFWTLSEGNDDERTACAKRLGIMIEAMEEEDVKKKTLDYCKDRLIRGLSSGRKFARVGFSVALTRLLRQFSDLDVSDLLHTIKEKLKVVKHEKRSKAEVGGIYLGRAFAYSSLIQSGVVEQMGGEAVQSMVDELITLAEKKSYLKPVCNKTLEDLVSHVSMDTFGEHVWPKLRDVMKEGWDSCTLDRLSLLLTCRETFPDVVNKKFVKKNWGFPLLGEENDDNLIRVILEAPMQKKEILQRKILPFMMKTRDVLSVWTVLGEKLMDHLPENKREMMTQRHLQGLQLAIQLIGFTDDTQQITELVLTPGLARKVFHTISKKNDPIAVAADTVFNELQTRLQRDAVSTRDIVETVWKLDAQLSKGQTGRVDLITANNFTTLVNMMSKEEAKDYADIMMATVKGQDKWELLSEKKATKTRQVEGALRHLLHLAVSQKFTDLPLQKSVLALFLRLAYFEVEKKNKAVLHCEALANFEEDSPTRKLCETFFFKALDQLSTLSTGQQSKSSHVTEYTELLYSLGQLFQTLMKTNGITAIQKWGEEFHEEWEKLFAIVTSMKQKSKKSTEARDSAFLLLFVFLGFHLITDLKGSSDLLQEVYVCYEKATSKPNSKKSPKKLTANADEGAEDEPAWVEVVTEVLLSLLSMQSHLGRVVTTMVFRSLTEQITPQAIQLITEVLIPKPGNKDDAGGVLVETENDDDGMDEGEEDEDNQLVDEDVPDEESDDDDDDEEEEEEEDDEVEQNGDMEADDDDEEEEEENEQVDEQFRQKVKEALGSAADDIDDDDDDDEEEDLPDLSDSEMFKLDEMLAEVFRQKKKAGSGKKGREEKKKEMAHFRARVLDLVEVLLKGDRCGDFVLDLMKPLLLLILKMNQSENQALCDRSRSLFHQLKAKTKSLKDEVHSADEQVSFFQELIELAHNVTDGSQMKEVSLACHIVMVLSRTSQDKQAFPKCVDVLRETLASAIDKKHSKLHLSFFSSLIELEPLWYQDLAPGLMSSLLDTATKVHGKTIACSVLTSLAKKKDMVKGEELTCQLKWMKDAATMTAQLITAINKNDMKVMLTKELLSLALALTARTDVFEKAPFPMDVKQHLMETKSKLNTDLRRLANKVIAAVEKSHLAPAKKNKQQKKKRSNSVSQEEDAAPPKKKKKT